MNRMPASLKFHNIWFFMTSRCNLACDYCFFRGRVKKQDLSLLQLENLFASLPKNRNYDFVFSGGEPLLVWDVVRDSFRRIRHIFPQSSLTLQTNMLFLDKDVLSVLKSYDCVVEPGLDGAFFVNQKHRKGFERKNYAYCLENISRLVASGLPMSPTMTVVPSETKRMFENFIFLKNLGLRHMEVHPAFQAGWNQQASLEFLKQYLNILLLEKKEQSDLIGKDYSLSGTCGLDLVVEPDGSVLPNWTYLTFSEKRRKPFRIMKLENKGVRIFPKKLRNFLKDMKTFYKERKSYRSFSNFNAMRILKNEKNQRRMDDFRHYHALCANIEVLDRSFMKKERNS